MSLYQNPLAANKSFQWSSAYYQSPDASGSSMPMIPTSIPSRGHDWSSSSFTSYLPEQHSAASSSTCGSSWKGNTPYSREPNPRSLQHQPENVYQTSLISMPIPDYPIASQRASLSLSSPPASGNDLAQYGLRTTRDESPLSHTSSSDYGTGTKGWDSPRSNADMDMRYTPFQSDAADVDESVEQTTSRSSSFPATAASHTSSRQFVKVEPNDQAGCFISENPTFTPTTKGKKKDSSSTRTAQLSSLISQSLAPPTEVPLRATQASKEMRLMMGVFRLNPFAINSLSTNFDEDAYAADGSQASWCGEAGPLEEEPVMLEFQLQLEGLVIEDDDEQTARPASDEASPLAITPTIPMNADEVSQLRSFSPGFELHSDEVTNSAIAHSIGCESGRHGQRFEEMEGEQLEAQSDSWSGTDCENQSEGDTISSHSIHTPLHSSPQSFQGRIHKAYETTDDSGYFSAPMWNDSSEQYNAEISYPASAPASQGKFELGHGYAGGKPRLHTTLSHPYLRKASMPHLTMPKSQTHSNLVTYSSQTQPMPGNTIHHLPTHHSQRQNAHIIDTVQSLHHQEKDVPLGSNSTTETSSFVGNYEVQRPMTTSSVSASYMRVERDPRQQYLDLEPSIREYSPSSASSTCNDASGYNATVFPSNVQHAHYNGTPNFLGARRWSLPYMGFS